jgi:hypothetical protein
MSTVKQITLFDKGAAQFQSYINMCIVSKDRCKMEDGSYRRELYYLSMFGPRGAATSTNAIFAGLVNASTIREIYIEDLGPVALMHRSHRMSGYAPGWSCSFAEFGSNRAVHALVESKALSLWDPSLAVKAKKSTTQDAEGNGKKLKQLASKEGEMSDKLNVALERRPLFFLMVPPGHDAAKLHLSYLDKRCPFPLIDEWAGFLWERALEKQEVEELEVWQYTSEGNASMIASAFFCIPDTHQMMIDLSSYIKAGSREEVAA